MRIRGWIGALVVVAVALALTGCTGMSQSRVHDFLASIARTHGVVRETHVQDSPAGYCEQTCYQGSATLVVGTRLSERGVLAIRDRIAAALTANHFDGFAMTLTLQQGSSHITLDATHAQYAVWAGLRRLPGMHGVNMEASDWLLRVTNRTTIVVTGTSRSTLIPVLRSSAQAIDSSGLFGKRIFLTSRTADARYYLAVDPHANPLPFLALDHLILTDPTLTGGSVDKSPLGGHGIVGIRVPSLAVAPDSYLRYDGIVAAYPGMYVHAIDFPGGSFSIYGHLAATDPAMVALRQVIATHAHLSGVGIEQVVGRATTLSFSVPTGADAVLVNTVILAHPELKGLAFCQVASGVDLGAKTGPDSGIGNN